MPPAPYEPFRPWWGPRVTVVNDVTNVTDVYATTVGHTDRNALSGGVSAIDRERFLQGRFDAGEIRFVDRLDSFASLPAARSGAERFVGGTGGRSPEGFDSAYGTADRS